MGFESKSAVSSGQVVASKTSGVQAASLPVERLPLLEGEEAELAVRSALSQDPLALQSLEAKDPGALETVEESARIRAMKQINAARIVAPALRAAISGEMEDDARVALFMSITQRSRLCAEGVLKVLGYDPSDRFQRWIVNGMERATVNLCVSGDVPSPALLTAFANAIDSRRDQKQPWAEFSQDTACALALARALAPVLAAQERFDFFRDKEADLERIRSSLLRTAAIGVQEACDPLTRTAERQTVFAVFIEEGGQMLADLWSRDTQRAQRAMQQQTKAQVEAWRKANPNGFPLETLFAAFEQQMARLIRLSKQRHVSER
jgi:hypothetical protein